MKIQAKYMGLELSSPIMVSACTLSEQTDNIVMMEDNGAGAVVMFSLFEEQIRKEEARFKGVISETTYAFPEALDFFPDLDDFSVGTDELISPLSGA
jgi:dihydroorotate dehydrogenase (fumarate)